MALSEYSVTIEVRSTPRLLRYLVDRTEDRLERRRLVLLGVWEIRCDGKAWEPLELGDMN